VLAQTGLTGPRSAVKKTAFLLPACRGHNPLGALAIQPGTIRSAAMASGRSVGKTAAPSEVDQGSPTRSTIQAFEEVLNGIEVSVGQSGSGVR
jgi:hypothetical protein